MNFCWWNVTKTVNFRTIQEQIKLVISLLLVHVSVFNLILLWAVILYSDIVQILEEVCMRQL